MQRAIGLDFGTTNSAVAVVEADGRARVAEFAFEGALFEVFRSVLFFERPESGPPPVQAGPAAIYEYLDGVEGRLLQSLKTFLGSTSLRQSQIYDRIYKLEDLLTYFLQSLRKQAEADLGPLGSTAVVGRPVRYPGDGTEESEALALSRMRRALAGAGFTEVTFEYEPVGAAHVYEADLDRDQTVLVADFGGGTSDFCVMRIGPSTSGAQVIDTAGLPIAGDTFDARIVRKVVAPALGYGTQYRASSGRLMTVPQWLYSHLEQWHHLSFLKDRNTHALLLELAHGAVEPDKLQAFRALIRDDLGFHVHQAVQAAKVGLSEDETALLQLQSEGLDLDVEISRADFEDWLADDMAAMAETVDGLLQRTGIGAPRIDQVFMTGGTSHVPVVQRLFAERFGPEKVQAGAAFTSVAVGLAAVHRAALDGPRG